MSALFPIRWTTNRRLATLALALGVGALAGDPQRGPTVRVDARELAAIVERELDHVTPSALADWIVQGRTDYRLLDLRDAASYAAYHIPTAEHVPMTALPEHPLARNETIVLYSDGGIHAAQGWFLLRAMDYPGVLILRGGLEAWREEVLFPIAPEAPTPHAAAAFERAAHVARFLGGAPRAAARAAAVAGAAPAPAPPAPAAPKIAPPSPGAGPPAAPRRTKKEGC